MFNNKLKAGIGIAGGIGAGLASLVLAKKVIAIQRNAKYTKVADCQGNEYSLDIESIIPDFEGGNYVVIKVDSFINEDSEDLNTLVGRALFNDEKKPVAYITEVKDKSLIGKLIE